MPPPELQSFFTPSQTSVAASLIQIGQSEEDLEQRVGLRGHSPLAPLLSQTQRQAGFTALQVDSSAEPREHSKKQAANSLPPPPREEGTIVVLQGEVSSQSPPRLEVERTL